MATATYTFTRTGSTTSAQTISFVVGGTATYGTDYTASGAASFSASAGSVVIPIGNSTASVVITTLADNAIESNESVTLSIGNDPTYVVGTIIPVVLTILNDDGTSVALAYASDGDSNGLFYYRGSAGGTAAWANPTGGAVLSLASTLDGASNTQSLINRADDDFYTTDAASSWVAFDVGTGDFFVISDYLLRARPFLGAGYDTQHIRSWVLEASNSIPAWTVAGLNTATWTALDARTSDATLSTNSVWGRFLVAGNSTSYRYYRIRQLGLNSSSADYLSLSEIEFYGILSI
jgi:hypothetical protein